MKNFTKISLMLIALGSTLLIANESIDAQIQKIHDASADQRVELMNNFKQQLRNMNSEDRMQAISSLRNSTDGVSQQNPKDMVRDSHIMQTNKREQMNQIGAVQQWSDSNMPGLPSNTNTNTATTQTPFSPSY